MITLLRTLVWSLELRFLTEFKTCLKGKQGDRIYQYSLPSLEYPVDSQAWSPGTVQTWLLHSLSHTDQDYAKESVP